MGEELVMKNVLRPTTHAAVRMSQRGIAEGDLELIQRIATEVEGGYLVRKKDYQAFERELKHLRDRARRLIGKRLVVQDGQLVTAYHAIRSKERRLLRDAQPGSLVE
jgi:hypothetical protein